MSAAPCALPTGALTGLGEADSKSGESAIPALRRQGASRLAHHAAFEVRLDEQRPGQRRLGEGAVAKVGALALRSREVGAREAASRRLCPLEEGVCEDGALGEKIAHRREGEDRAAKVGSL